MTLILSAVVGDYAFQVSDRRLTLPNGSLHDDDTNKAVFFINSFAFSFTGLAYINNTRTVDWLTQTLLNAQPVNKVEVIPRIQTINNTETVEYIPVVSISDAVSHLAKQATEEFRKINLSKKNKRTAFVAIGWKMDRESFLHHPVIYSISNAHTADFGWISEAVDEFTVQYSIGPAEPCLNLISSGQILDPDVYKTLRRNLLRCFKHKRGPEPVAQYLIQQMYSTAEQNSIVGKNLLVICLPKKCNDGTILTSFSPTAPVTMKDCVSFCYLGPNGKDKVQFGPNAVGIGMGTKNFIGESDDNGQKVSVTLLRPENS